MKLDYKSNRSWSLAHPRSRRQPRRVRRHVLAMSVCAVLTFVGYTKYSDNRQHGAEVSWSIPGSAMAAYPVLHPLSEQAADQAVAETAIVQTSIAQPTDNKLTFDSAPAAAVTIIEPIATIDDTHHLQLAMLAPPETLLLNSSPVPTAHTLAEDAEYEILSEAPASDVPELETDWQKVSIKRGDSMAQIFNRLGLSPRQLHEIMQLGEVTQALKQLQPGQELLFDIDANGEQLMLQTLQYDPDNLHQLTVQRTDDGFEAELAAAELTYKVRAASATINSSLFLSGQEVGISDNVIMQMVAIYGWDIDFALDIRKGDQFTVIFKEVYRDGVKIDDGPILAAEFINQDRVLRAVRYTTPDGHSSYYTEDGKSMRKAFLRTPLDVFRISSHFSLGRKHPILNRIRAHKGTDYAAPTGTPIKAAGDGRVDFIGRKGGYGNAIVLQHGSKYSTLYGHMSRFARGLESGERVEQGQIIGYVGSTGLATGPHLHYEFRVNGVHKNPETVELPKALSIPDELQADFHQSTQLLLAKLDKLERFAGHLEVNDHQLDAQLLALLEDSGDTTEPNEAR